MKEKLHTATLTVVTAGFLTLAAGCGQQAAAPQTTDTGQQTASKYVLSNSLPKKGKLRLPVAPAGGVVGQVYLNTTENKEYIWDGEAWIPHSAEADTFKKPTAAKVLAMAQADVCADGDPACTPSGGHARHNAACSVCHRYGGRLAFDRNGPAYGSGAPAPNFDATAKTCSNIACHGMPAGVFTYYFPGGDGEPELKTFAYGGNLLASTTPSWYTTLDSLNSAATCGTCHGAPPRTSPWHSGSHGNGLIPGGNECQFCHPDAVSTNGVVTGLNSATTCGPDGTTACSSFHGNATVDVVAKFTLRCFGCH